MNSIRIAANERPSPDEFGLTFHVLIPLQDSVGIITPSALHFAGTHRDAIVPDIDPREYRFLLHGMVDRPLEFTLEELKRFPSVSRINFIECLGNRAKPEHKTVQTIDRFDQLQRMDDCIVAYGQNGEPLRECWIGSAKSPDNLFSRATSNRGEPAQGERNASLTILLRANQKRVPIGSSVCGFVKAGPCFSFEDVANGIYS